jgi:3-methyl-2-oxobutanoate hydroxymethyltransferase
MGDWSPRFAKQYAHLGSDLEAAAKEYAAEVKSGAFPSPEQSYLQ